MGVSFDESQKTQINYCFSISVKWFSGFRSFFSQELFGQFFVSVKCPGGQQIWLCGSLGNPLGWERAAHANQRCGDETIMVDMSSILCTVSPAPQTKIGYIIRRHPLYQGTPPQAFEWGLGRRRRYCIHFPVNRGVKPQCYLSPMWPNARKLRNSAQLAQLTARSQASRWVVCPRVSRLRYPSFFHYRP